MMKKTIAILFCVILCGALVMPLCAQTIKLASLVPENTPWGDALNNMAREFSEATKGAVTLQIYHNGVAGGEQDVLRKLKQNQIQAAILSSTGMSLIANEIMTLSVPFLIRTDDELDMVLTNLKDELEKRINNKDKDLYVLAWARAGWVKIFSKRPVFVPDDLKKQYMGTAKEQPEMEQAFKAMGYKMVGVDMNEILIALSNNTIEAVYQSPVAVGGLQIFGLAKNMASINIAPFMGGIIMNTRCKRIIDKYPQLIQITRKYEKQLDTSIMKLEDDVIGTMGNYGLVVNQVAPAQAQAWYDDVGKAMPRLLGTTFNKEIYDKIEALLKNYRAGKR